MATRETGETMETNGVNDSAPGVGKGNRRAFDAHRRLPACPHLENL